MSAIWILAYISIKFEESFQFLTTLYFIWKNDLGQKKIWKIAFTQINRKFMSVKVNIGPEPYLQTPRVYFVVKIWSSCYVSQAGSRVGFTPSSWLKFETTTLLHNSKMARKLFATNCDHFRRHMVVYLHNFRYSFYIQLGKIQFTWIFKSSIILTKCQPL